MTTVNLADHAPYDGTTDAWAGWMTALGKLNVNRGGTIRVPAERFYFARGPVCTIPGLHIECEGQTGVQDGLARGSAQWIVGDGQVGLTLGGPTSEFRGHHIEGLHFYERNPGKALGGLLIKASSDGSYERVCAGGFANGYGIKVDGITPDVQAQYNTFTDCRVGTCKVGYWQRCANGTYWSGGYAEGSMNGRMPTAGTTGLLVESGDSFTLNGTRIQGYDTLLDLGPNLHHDVAQLRCEVWKTLAVRVRGGIGARQSRVSGRGDNSIVGGIGTGIQIDTGVNELRDGMLFVNVATKRVDNGTGTVRV